MNGDRDEKVYSYHSNVFMLTSMMVACANANNDEANTEKNNIAERMSDEEIINNLCDGE